MIELNDMAEKMLAVAQKRQSNGAFIKNDTLSILKHCATEVVEATEAYVRCDNFISDGCSEEKFASELADIIACALIAAAIGEIDIEKVLNDCYEKNRNRAEGKGDKK